MQDRYTGDIGDFGKYGLLRAMTRAEGDEHPMKLGVVWYLAPPEDNRDGQRRDFLRPGNRIGEQLRRCDSELYTVLMGLEPAEYRCVNEVRMRDILPPGTEFHEEDLDPRGVKRVRGSRIAETRAASREQWHERALERTKDCQLVFLDPDNGMEPENTRAGDLRAGKYALHSEVRDYLERGQSLVVYHHLNRSARATNQIHQRQLEIFRKMQRRALVLRYHRGSPRAFILIPQAEHREELTHRVRGMMEGPWARHFSVIG